MLRCTAGYYYPRINSMTILSHLPMHVLPWAAPFPPTPQIPHLLGDQVHGRLENNPTACLLDVLSQEGGYLWCERYERCEHGEDGS